MPDLPYCPRPLGSLGSSKAEAATHVSHAPNLQSLHFATVQDPFDDIEFGEFVQALAWSLEMSS